MEEIQEMFDAKEMFVRPIVKEVWMTPDEYIKRCADVLGTTTEALILERVDERLKNILKLFTRQIKLNMPTINYIEKTQDGLHRAMASSILGIQKIPVIIIETTLEKVILEEK